MGQQYQQKYQQTIFQRIGDDTLQSDLAAGRKSEVGLITVYLSAQLFTVHHIFLVHLFATKPK